MPYAAGLYYEEHGPAGAPPLILSSGLGGSATYWKLNIPALAEAYRVVAYDYRGTGRSDRELPDTVTVDDFADDMLGLMDALEIGRAHLVGHAAGGVAGLALALKAPARLDRLVVVNGWAKADPHFLRCFEARLNLLRHAGVEAFLRAQPIFLYPADWASEHHAAIAAELPDQLVHFPGAGTTEKRIAALAAFDVSARLAEIDLPVLVIAARDDMLVPSRAGDALARAVPKAGFARPEYGGHAYNFTCPDSFDALVLGWLAGEPPGEK